MSWQSSSASTFGFDTTTDLGESAALPTAMASGDTGGTGEVELEVDEGGDGIFGGQEGPVVVVPGGISKFEKECARKKMRRPDPEIRAEENRKKRYKTYKIKYGGTLDYDAWKLACDQQLP